MIDPQGDIADCSGVCSSDWALMVALSACLSTEGVPPVAQPQCARSVTQWHQ
ncbi:hypothetical protein ACLK1S_15350 [Escherichia coli]